MSYSFLQSKINSGELVLWYDYRRWNQTFLDLSGQGNDAATISNVWYGGGGIQFADNNGYVQVADAAELQGTTWTLAVLGDWTNLERTNDTTSGRLISKRDAGGTQYDWLLNNTPQFDLYDGTTTRSLAVEHRGHRLLAVSFADNATPVGYLDGISAGNYNGASSISVDDAPVYVGNWYSANRSTYNTIQAVLIFNTQLTATEHSDLFGELMSLPGGEH